MKAPEATLIPLEENAKICRAREEGHEGEIIVLG